MSDLQRIERSIKRELESFLDPTPPPRKPRVAITKGLTVILAVRKKPLASDHRFEHRTNSISRLQARLEAERAAREAGWPIIGYVIEYT